LIFILIFASVSAPQVTFLLLMVLAIFLCANCRVLQLPVAGRPIVVHSYLRAREREIHFLEIMDIVVIKDHISVFLAQTRAERQIFKERASELLWSVA
jgi:hypothetical protein